MLRKVLCPFDETVRWFREREASACGLHLRLASCRYWRPNVQLDDTAELDPTTHSVLCALVLWVEVCMAMAERASPWSSRRSVYEGLGESRCGGGGDDEENDDDLADRTPQEATERNERLLWRLRVSTVLDLAYHMENRGVYDDATLNERDLDYERTDYERLRPLDHSFFWSGELPNLVHMLKWVDWFGGYSELERDERASAHEDEGFLAGPVCWGSVMNTSSNLLSRIPVLIILSKAKPGLCHFKRWHDEIVRQCRDEGAGIYELQTMLMRCTLFGLYPHCETGPSFPRQLQLMKFFCEDAVRNREATIEWFADHDMLLWFAWKEYIVHLMRYHAGLREVLVRQRNWRRFESTTAYGTDVARRAFDEHGILEGLTLSVKSELHKVYTKRQVKEVRRAQKETFLSCLAASLNRVFDQKYIADRGFMPEHEMRKKCLHVYHLEPEARKRRALEWKQHQERVKVLREMCERSKDLNGQSLVPSLRDVLGRSPAPPPGDLFNSRGDSSYEKRRRARSIEFTRRREELLARGVSRIAREAPEIVLRLWRAEMDRERARVMSLMFAYQKILRECDIDHAEDKEQRRRDVALANKLGVDASGECEFVRYWKTLPHRTSSKWMRASRMLSSLYRQQLDTLSKQHLDFLYQAPPLTDHALKLTPWFIRRNERGPRSSAAAAAAAAAASSSSSSSSSTSSSCLPRDRTFEQALEKERATWQPLVDALAALKQEIVSRIDTEEEGETVRDSVLFLEEPFIKEPHDAEEDEERKHQEGRKEFATSGALGTDEMRLVREFASHFSPDDRIVPADFELWGVDPWLVRRLFELWERYERCEAFYQGTRETLYFTLWFAPPRDFHLLHALAVHLKEHFQVRWQLVSSDTARRQHDALRSRHELHDWEETPQELLYTNFCPSCRSLACRVMKQSSGEAVAHEIGVANAAFDWDEDCLYAKSAQTRSQHAAKTRRTARQQSENPRKDAEREAKRARRVRFFPRCNDQPLEKLFAVGVRWTIGRTVNTLCERCGIKTIITELSCSDANGTVCPRCRYSEGGAVKLKHDEWHEARRLMDPHERTRVETRLVTSSSSGRTRLVTETVRVRNEDDHPDMQLDAEDQCHFCPQRESTVRKRRRYVQWHRYRVLDDRVTNDFVHIVVCDLCFRRYYSHFKFRDAQWTLSQLIGFVDTARPVVRKNRRLVPIFEKR